MARTIRKRPLRIRGCGHRENLRTQKERRNLLAFRDECAEEGVKLSEHRRYVPSNRDDIPISAYREARW